MSRSIAHMVTRPSLSSRPPYWRPRTDRERLWVAVRHARLRRESELRRRAREA